MNIIL